MSTKHYYLAQNNNGVAVNLQFTNDKDVIRSLYEDLKKEGYKYLNILPAEVGKGTRYKLVVKEETDDTITAEKYFYFDNFAEERATLYPKIEEQLDALWHDINTGKDLSQGEFYKMIESVKTKVPKT